MCEESGVPPPRRGFPRVAQRDSLGRERVGGRGRKCYGHGRGRVDNGSNRVKRGGSFNNDASNLRSSNRNNDTPSNRNANNGGRCLSPMQLPAAARITVRRPAQRHWPWTRAPGPGPGVG
jgi:hypothetical protein